MSYHLTAFELTNHEFSKPRTVSEKSESGAEGRGEQRRGLRTKALMRDLGTRLECRQRFCKNWKNFVEVNQ